MTFPFTRIEANVIEADHLDLALIHARLSPETSARLDAMLVDLAQDLEDANENLRSESHTPNGQRHNN